MRYLDQWMEELKQCAATNIHWSLIDGKSFFITGATGGIGKYLVALLLFRNEYFNGNIRITITGRSEEKYKRRFADILQMFSAADSLEFLEQDLMQPLNEGIRSDYIIHLASNTHPRLYAQDPIGTEMTNILGTYHLLKSMRTGSRFFFGSSGDIYGDNRSDKLYIDENDCGYINCNTLRAGYIEGKRAGEALCQAFKEAEHINFVIGRLCRAYGHTMQLEDSKAISQFVLKAVKQEDVVLKSAGNQIFSYLHIADIVRAILVILTDGTNGEAYNIADKNQAVSLKELAETLADISGNKVVMEVPDQQEQKGASDFQSVILNSEKLENIGWKPLYQLKEGLLTTVDMLRLKIQ